MEEFEKMQRDMEDRKGEEKKASAEAKKPAEGPKILDEYTIQKGDTLAGIALKYYGNSSRRHYMFLYNTNKDVIGKDPDLIRAGAKLKVQELPENLKPKERKAPEGVNVIAEHTVVAGDTLSGIALKYYKNASEPAYMAIYEVNKDVIGDNPNLIGIGMKLYIPAYP